MELTNHWKLGSFPPPMVLVLNVTTAPSHTDQSGVDISTFGVTNSCFSEV